VCSSDLDFCSGGGHLGIFLAYMFPDCQFKMIENKEESHELAIKRISMLGIRNCHVYKVNLLFYNFFSWKCFDFYSWSFIGKLERFYRQIRRWPRNSCMWHSDWFDNREMRSIQCWHSDCSVLLWLHKVQWSC